MNNLNKNTSGKPDRITTISYDSFVGFFVSDKDFRDVLIKSTLYYDGHSKTLRNLTYTKLNRIKGESQKQLKERTRLEEEQFYKKLGYFDDCVLEYWMNRQTLLLNELKQLVSVYQKNNQDKSGSKGLIQIKKVRTKVNSFWKHALSEIDELIHPTELYKDMFAVKERKRTDFDTFEKLDEMVQAVSCGQEHIETNELQKMILLMNASKTYINLRANLPADFGKALSACMHAGGFTNESLSECSELSVSQISRLRSGATKRPNLQTVVKLCIAMKLDPFFSQEMLHRAGYTLLNDSSEEEGYSIALRFLYKLEVKEADRILKQLGKKGLLEESLYSEEELDEIERIKEQLHKMNKK